MLGALIIVFREMLEAGLIVGIVLAATQGVFRQSSVILAYDAIRSRDVQLVFSGRFDKTYERIDTLVLNPPQLVFHGEPRHFGLALFLDLRDRGLLR